MKIGIESQSEAMTAILIVGIFVSFAQFLLLFTKRSRTVSDRILAFWMLVVGLHLLSYSLHLNGYWEIYPHLVGLTVPFPLLYGPMLYLYVLYSLEDRERLQRTDTIHFLPAAAAYLYMSRFYFFYTAEEKRLVDAGEIDDFGTFSTLLLISFIISGISYSVAAYRHLDRHRQLVEANFSDEAGVTLRWLRNIIRGLGLFFVAATFVIVVQELAGFDVGFTLDYILYSLLVLGILWLGYHGIRHQNIFADNDVYVPDKDAQSEYRTSGLSDEVAKDIYSRLMALMEGEKPWREPKLTLSALASMLDTSPNYLSQVINQYEQQNFNQFINEYRIRSFVERARANAQLTLLAHALDVGFNSKSTFNMVFKRHRGTTPSQFIAQSRTEPQAL